MSDSIYFLYSSGVVAPINLISPLANAGFIIFDASMAPSAPPAPTTICISSINKTISPDAALISSITAVSLSSNSPLNFAPANNDAISSFNNFLFFKDSGTSSITILCANPSTKAVLPTPASPIITGLFFVLLVRVCTTLCISLSLPTTGSNCPALANLVKSTLYFSKA